MPRRSTPGENTTLRTVARSSAYQGAAHGSDLVLHVVLERSVTQYPLPKSGSVLIGRSSECDLRIEDPSISRRHATVHMGPPLRIEDLGGANGVAVGGARLKQGQQADIAAGAVLELGHVMVVVQESASAPRPRRVWSHGYFEGRVEDECARAEKTRSPFAIARVHVEPGSRGEIIEPIMSSALRASDVLARYGPGDLEALLVDAAQAEAADVVAQIVAALERAGIPARVGLACFPGDGRAPDALLAKASDTVRTPAKTKATGMAPVFGSTLQQLETVLARVARGHINVFVTGETGVGKELVAERVHALSPRAGKPLVRLNCAALSETLLASELFGHERGAFTGADRAKPGLLEAADGGTVFLDEVGDLPMSIQPKLLRVLEDKIVTRVGAIKGRTVDVRFVAATNRDLEGEIAQGRFRADLFFRLNGFQLRVPPLRERRSDIIEIARGFLAQAAGEAGLQAPELSSEVLEVLAGYSWPGNVRELRNVIERAVLLCVDGIITLEHLPIDKMQQHVTQGASAFLATSAEDDALDAALAARERLRLEAALAQHGGNQTHAARALGISRGTLLARMDAYSLTRPRKRPRS
jgi:two-component system response regulator AtoC